jgi:ubiquinol-cytochrome c reductase cytochrome b subunit
MKKSEQIAGNVAGYIDDRTGAAGWAKKNLTKVFPDHWSFMLGEIALYSFVILLLSGTFLTFWFDPSQQEVVYNGAYAPLKNVSMSASYASTLHISFDVRGGLLMRQIHHWAALIFMAAIVVHLLRVFFTGAFRKPREANWLIGIGLLTLGIVEGFLGYSLMIFSLEPVSVSLKRSSKPSQSLVHTSRTSHLVEPSLATSSSLVSTSFTCSCSQVSSSLSSLCT